MSESRKFSFKYLWYVLIWLIWKGRSSLSQETLLESYRYCGCWKKRTMPKLAWAFISETKKFVWTALHFIITYLMLPSSRMYLSDLSCFKFPWSTLTKLISDWWPNASICLSLMWMIFFTSHWVVIARYSGELRITGNLYVQRQEDLKCLYGKIKNQYNPNYTHNL